MAYLEIKSLLQLLSRIKVSSQTTRPSTGFSSAPQRWKGDRPAFSHCALEESMPGMSCLQFKNLKSDWQDQVDQFGDFIRLDIYVDFCLGWFSFFFLDNDPYNHCVNHFPKQ